MLSTISRSESCKYPFLLPLDCEDKTFAETTSIAIINQEMFVLCESLLTYSWPMTGKSARWQNYWSGRGKRSKGWQQAEHFFIHQLTWKNDEKQLRKYDIETE